MSVGGSGTATAAGPTTAIGRIIPFMMWGAPSALGIQQASTYNPGASAWVAWAVSPTVTALGPPAKEIHGGGGVWFCIAACSPAWKSVMVLPSPSRTSEAWWSSLPRLTRRRVVSPAGVGARAPDAEAGAGGGADG